MFNFIRYGCSYTDYFRGDYINLNAKQKKTFVTAKSFYKILHYLNDDEEREKLNNKIIFDGIFKEYLKRDFIDLRTATLEDFENFINGKEIFFAKVIDGLGGHGTEKIIVNSYPNKEDLFSKLKEKRQYLCEEAIIQSDELNEINPYVVNSYRVVTLYKDGEAYVIGNALRVNQGTDSVIGCTDDLYFSFDENGYIDSNVVDDYGNIYDEHPLTHKKFKEVHVNGVREAFEMCKKCALKLPKVRYIGWDVAFTPNGPVLIEGNEYPGYGILQYFKLKGSKTGHKAEIEAVIGDEINRI